MSEKTTLTRERTRPRYDVSSVLETCVAVFNEQGYDGTSMEDLSRRLGISKSSIYHHVESKEAILGMFNGRDLIDPGLVLVSYWRPEGGDPGPDADKAWVYGGVAAV